MKEIEIEFFKERIMNMKTKDDTVKSDNSITLCESVSFLTLTCFVNMFLLHNVNVF